MSEEDSMLVKHARTELELVGEEPETIDGLVEVIRAFSKMGHSGGSASVAIPMLERLLRFQNLAPLNDIKDAPEEWTDHSGISGSPTWQNHRNGAVFSDDGVTYYNVDQPRYRSVFVNNVAEVLPRIHNSHEMTYVLDGLGGCAKCFYRPELVPGKALSAPCGE